MLLYNEYTSSTVPVFSVVTYKKREERERDRYLETCGMPNDLYKSRHLLHNSATYNSSFSLVWRASERRLMTSTPLIKRFRTFPKYRTYLLNP